MGIDHGKKKTKVCLDINRLLMEGLTLLISPLSDLFSCSRPSAPEKPNELRTRFLVS